MGGVVLVMDGTASVLKGGEGDSVAVEEGSACSGLTGGREEDGSVVRAVGSRVFEVRTWAESAEGEGSFTSSGTAMVSLDATVTV